MTLCRFIVLSLTVFALPLQAFELKPFSASYTADWKQSLPFSGTATRTLSRQDNGQWTLQFKASMLVVNLRETSIFLDKGSHLQPIKYEFKRGGLASKKKLIQRFDWEQLRLTGQDDDDAINLPLLSGLLDKSTYQVSLQRDVAQGKHSMTYQVVDEDEVEAYDFRVLGEEQVSTPLGQIDAIKVERVRDPTQSKRQTTLWLAKDWNYLLVRLHQVEKDGKEYQIVLEEGRVDGQSIKGR